MPYALICFIYGLAFFCLGFGVLLRIRPIAQAGLVRRLRWVAAFGILHGLGEWLIMARQFGTESEILRTIEAVTMAASYAALLVFGLSWAAVRRGGAILAYAVPVACLAVWALVWVASPNDIVVDVTARYLLGIPAAASAGLALLFRRDMFDSDRRGRILRWSTALGFLAYSGMTAVSSGGAFFPASTLNYQAFDAFTGTPIQIWRAGAAVLITVAFVLALDRFDRHEKSRLAEKTRSVLAELEANQRRFRAVVDNTLDIITLLAPDGTIKFESPSIESILGYARDELVGRSAFDFVHPDDLSEATAALQRVIAQPGQAESLEIRFRHKDGSWRYLESIGRNLLHDRSVDAVIVTSRDITDRKRAEEIGTRLGRIIEDSVNEIYVFDSATLRFVQVNRGARENIGYSMEELRNLTPLDLKPEFTLQEFKSLIRPLRDRSVDLLTFDTIHRRKDGSTYDVEVRLQLTATESPAVFFAIIQDVTDRKRTEAQLRQAQKMEAVGQLTGGIAHDFNNLLTVVLGNLELLHDDAAASQNQKQIAKSAIGATQRGAMLTDRLLSFSRRQTLHPVGLDLAELVAGMTALLRRALGETIEIETVSTEELWPALADPAQVESALLNLALNARDAMPAGGKLTITSRNAHIDDDDVAAQTDLEAGDYVLMTVSDTGAGMPQNVVERVFEPFFTTKGVGMGSGLGLSMVYGFAKQSGGCVTISSEERRGTTVRLYLPRAGEAERKAKADPAPNGPKVSEETILVVEDDPDVRALAVRLLGDLGYDVLEAGDAASAVSVMKSISRIDLLFTDVVLAGGMSGPEVAMEAKRIHPAIGILFMSGYPCEAINRNGQLDEGSELLNKPFRKVDLARKVRAVLRNAA